MGTNNLTQKLDIAAALDRMILTEDDIADQKIELSDLFEVEFDGFALGHVHKNNLQLFLRDHHILYGQMKIAHFASKDWIEVYDHPLYQRRKPQILNQDQLENLTELTLWVLINGLKKGPYAISEIHQMVNRHELLITDMVSLDKGSNWKPLYSIDEFDRRKLKNSHALPECPDAIFESHQLINQSKDSSTDAIASLAYMSNLNQGKAQEGQSLPVEEDLATPEKQTNWIKVVVLTSSILFFCYEAYKMYQKMKPQNAQDEMNNDSIENVAVQEDNVYPENRAKSYYPRANLVQKTATQNHTNRSTSTKYSYPNNAKNLNPMEIKAVDNNSPVEEQFYFDEGEGQLEADPVRAQISKETLDPLPESSSSSEPKNVFANETTN